MTSTTPARSSSGDPSGPSLLIPLTRWQDATARTRMPWPELCGQASRINPYGTAWSEVEEGWRGDDGRRSPDRARPQRPLPDRRAHRARRNGKRVLGDRSAARPSRRDQGHAPRPRRRPAVHRAIRPRGQVRRQAQPPQRGRRCSTRARMAKSPTSSWSTSRAARCATSCAKSRRCRPTAPSSCSSRC